jgi:GAF domain-containing protein
VAKKVVSEKKAKPVLEEQALANLLEAAYVLQEHNRELQELDPGSKPKREQMEAQSRAVSVPPAVPPSEKAAPADSTPALAQIAETQHQIQVRHLDLDAAMGLVAERVMEIAHGAGAAIAMAEGETVRYRAAKGQKTPATDTPLPMDKALCAPCLRSSQVFRGADINPELLVDTEECRRRGIQSLIAVPIFHDGGVAGGLELYYSSPHGFTDQEVHTCQLMAGLVTEALARQKELALRKTLAAERAAMLEALEKLQPDLEALITPAKEAASHAPADPAEPESGLCRRCGREVAQEEQFCGQCGLSRSEFYEPVSMQTKLASMWLMREANKNGAAPPDASAEAAPPEPPPQAEFDGTLTNEDLSQFAAELAADMAELEIENTEPEPTTDTTDREKASEVASSSDAKAAVPHAPDWSSASAALGYLERVISDNRRGPLIRLWHNRRGDIYLAVAVILMICVIRWGIWSRHSASAPANPTTAASHQKPDPEAGLSFFDRMLVSLGLAEPPEVPEDQGNPTTQVWVDLHTALYYCPGADLYGKTPTGKFTTQRAARLDQFQPAYRKVCN